MMKAKRVFTMLLVLCMLIGMLPVTVLAEQSKTGNTIYTTEEIVGNVSENTEQTEADEPGMEGSQDTTVTRAQWLQMLVRTFDYSIGGEIVPDNYFPDLSAESEYYEDVLIAVYYGLVDVLPNSNLNPDEAATREFAAYTLNACMGYMPETTEGYSFKEAETVTYASDIQVAIERGWFALVDGAFLPEQAITEDEKTVMMADAQAYIAYLTIDAGHENQYTFQEGVVVITDVAEITSEENGTVVVISELTQELTEGDRFVVFVDGLAIPYEAVSITVSNGQTIINARDLYFEEAIESMDVQLETDANPANFYAAEDTELIFIEEETGEEYTRQAMLYALSKGSSSIYIPKYTKKLDLGSGVSASVSVEMKNAKLFYNVDLGALKASASVWLDTDVDVSLKMSCKLTDIDGEGFEVYIGGYEIPGVGGLSVNLKIDVTGSISVVKKLHLKAGLTINFNALKLKLTPSNIFKVTDKGSSINAEISAKVYVEAKFGLYGKALPLKGYFYAETGFKAKVKYTTYSEIPGECIHFAAHLYAEFGFKVEWGALGYKDSIDFNKEMIKEDNSPVKISLHYEDGLQVASCTRKDFSGTTSGDPSSIADSGYTTGSGSSYSGSGLNRGSSTGHTSSGEPVIIYTYSLDEDNNATITSYSGNATSLTIPLTLDGYAVVAIGENAFKKNTTIRTIIMQDNILTIGEGAFMGCSNLRNLTLSESLTEIGASAFQNCTRLTTVDIPDGVTFIGSEAFMNCSALQAVNLSSSLVEIEDSAFKNCTSLTEITIPKTLEESSGYTYYAEYGIFYGCTSLKTIVLEEGMTAIPDYLLQGSCIETITIPDSVTRLGEACFRECKELKEIVIPNTVTFIGAQAFMNCSALQAVNLSSSLVEIEDSAFKNCTSLTEITIPKTLEESSGYTYYAEYGIFYGCTSLKTIVLEEGMTAIPNFLLQGSCIETIKIPDSVTRLGEACFRECKELKEIVIPNTVTFIGAQAFMNCSALQAVSLSSGLVEIEDSVFKNCTSLKEITIPKTLEKCSGYTYYAEYGIFYGCTSLKTIVLEEGMTAIPNFLLQGSCIETIKIPDSVTRLGEACFRGCKELKEIVIPNTVTFIGAQAFMNCSALQAVSLSSSLVEIEDSVFKNCTSLTEITIPKALVKCSGYTYYAECGIFYGCTSLKTIVLEEGMTAIPDYLLQGSCIETITIPDSVTRLGEACFRGCKELKEIVIPNTVIYIETNVFAACAALQTISWPSSLTAVPEGTFEDCTGLTMVNLPDNLLTIDRSAFRNCDALVTFTMPDSVTTVGDYAFYDCDALTEIHLSEGLTKLKESTFYDCDALVSIDIPGSVTSVGRNCFYDCDALVTVTMGDQVTTMGYYVFYHCDVLKNVKLSWNLEKIPESAFQQCAELEEIVVPYYVTEIGKNAFNSSPKLVKVVLPRSLTSIGKGAFSYADVTVIYGVAGTYAETWANENGYTFVDHQVNATGISLDVTELTMNNGNSYSLILSISPENITDEITWKSSNTDVVTVTDRGVLKAVGVGTATIKVVVGNVSASCKVTVIQPVTRINLNKSKLTMEGGETYTLIATVRPDNAANKALRWESSDPSVVSVDENGVLTAHAKGTATITVTALDGSGVTQTCTVTVTNTLYVVTDPTAMESPHNYENNCKDVWAYTSEGAMELRVTFDALTEMEDGFDYLYIYDGQGNMIGKYTGLELSGATVTVPGDTVRIQIESDDSGAEWGFKVTAIESVTHVHTPQSIAGFAPTCTEDGLTEGSVCAECGEILVAQEVIPAIGHNYVSEQTPPTCVSEGYTTHTCVNCGDTYQDTFVGPVNHEYEKFVMEPTCTEGGYTAYTCVSCGNSYIADETSALGHDMSDWAQTKAPTCTAEGEEASACSRCDYAETRKLDAKGHSEEIDPAVAPSCTETGLSEGKHCSVCQAVLVAQTTLDALGHNFGEWYTVTEPGEYDDGLEERNCSRCGHKETRAIPAIGHTHSYDAAVTAPTCTEGGYTTHTCRCGDSYITDETAALGHSYEDAITVPTCEKQGYTTHTCARCGDSYVDGYTEATGHSWDEGIITREPTVEAEGEKTYTCTACGQTRTETMPKKEPVIYDTPEDNSVQIPENDCFEGGTTVTVEKVEAGEIFDKASSSMESFAALYTVFEFTASKDGETVPPNGKLTVSFMIPADYSTNVSLYYMDQNGKLTKLDVVIDAEARTVTVELEHFSTYILADQDSAPQVLFGDVNGDGRINARDARALLRYLAGLDDESMIDMAAADFNGDGRINARDARAILQKIAGIG